LNHPGETSNLILGVADDLGCPSLGPGQFSQGLDLLENVFLPVQEDSEDRNSPLLQGGDGFALLLFIFRPSEC